jgi:hypothetical protein
LVAGALALLVGASAGTAAAGTLLDADPDKTSGSAYVFSRHGEQWVQEAKLTASGAPGLNVADDPVAVSRDTVVVGSPFDDTGAKDSGSAHVYSRVGGRWIKPAKLMASDSAAGDHFGDSVAVTRDTVVIGAPGDWVE